VFGVDMELVLRLTDEEGQRLREQAELEK